MPLADKHIPGETYCWLYFHNHVYLLSINYAKVLAEIHLVSFSLPLCHSFLLTNQLEDTLFLCFPSGLKIH